MPRPYPPEFRARAVALVRTGKQAKQTAVELGIHPVVPRQVFGRISSLSKLGMVGSARPRCTSIGRFQAIAS